ncbi:hypothetical protein Bca52824_092720 [Brassica carinata]|uniref:F-box domain-containing protein n=1 Tax=Brassica carinata TaxID=52824 RepID=A0A8X7P8S1_BRACI|nr:hypothetical protein Bca52824_092720 [Brassica carinata]
MGSRVLPDWTELTPECLLDIFSRLSIWQRWNGPMLVCKTWANICQDPYFNTILDLEAEFLSSEDSNHWWSPEFEEKVDSTIRFVVDQSKGSLKEIRVRHCTDQSLSYVAERCPNLEVLGVTYSPKVTVESMRKIASNCTKLKELDISCSYEISAYCIELVGTSCKNIHILKRNLMPPSEITRLKQQCTYVQGLSFETLGNVDAHSISKYMSQGIDLAKPDMVNKMVDEATKKEMLGNGPNGNDDLHGGMKLPICRDVCKVSTLFAHMGSRVHPDWTELPPECLLGIFSRLSMGQRRNGPMLVCKTWKNLCQDPSLNTTLDLEAEFLSSPDSIYWWSPEFEEKVSSTIRSVVHQSEGGLKEIRVSVRHCTDQSLSYVAERCPNLEVLGVTYSPKVTVDSMRKIASNCTKLKELDISCSYLISGECIEIVGTNCKNIHTLKRNLMQTSEIVRYLTSDGVTNSISSLKNLKEIKKPDLQCYSNN